MRKTVHEWLEANQNGNAMAKRKKRRRKPPLRQPQELGMASEGLLDVKRRPKKK